MFSLSMNYAADEVMANQQGREDNGEPDWDDWELGFSCLSKSSKLPPRGAEPQINAENWPGPWADGNDVPFPTKRRIWRRETDLATPLEVVKTWFEGSGIQLGPLVADDMREDVMRTFYTYRDLEGTTVADIPPTDLFVHKPRLKEGTRPWNRSPRRRWTEPQAYWMNRLVNEGLAAGMFESTVAANGELSAWSAEPVMVQTDLTDPWAEQRFTTNYSHVTEDLPGIAIPLLADLHDKLSDPRVKAYCKFDLKHAYWSIPVDTKLRHLLAFSVPGFPQLQATRMPQGTQSAAFSMTEAMQVALGPIPGPKAEPSLLAPMAEGGITPLESYIDDIFGKFESMEALWHFVKNHLLPRLLWSLLKLSFKKVAIGMTEMLAVGWVHRVGGIMTIKPERSAKLREFPTPTDVTQVRQFLGTLGPCRRWIKNCSEIARPLNRLTGDVEWRWGEAEALSFALLRDPACNAIEMSGFQWDLPCHMYSDASGYGGGCAIIQPRDGIQYPVLYDSFLFTRTQRNYGTYKRELYAIVEFCRRHNHFFKAQQRSTVYTDHKPLTWFLESSSHEGIYARWVSELRLLNLDIRYIEGPRNKVADALSRTIFAGDGCEPPEGADQLGALTPEGEWRWKDGVGGYEEMLRLKTERETPENPVTAMWATCASQFEGPTRATWRWRDGEGFGAAIASLDDAHHASTAPIDKEHSLIQLAMAILDGGSEGTLAEWMNDPWYGDIVKTLLGHHASEWDRHERNRMKDKTRRFWWNQGTLWYRERSGEWVRCLREGEVRPALEAAHDRAGHFGPDITKRNLLREVWWPRVAGDVVEYIAGCYACAQHAPNRPKAPDQPVFVDRPFLVLGIDYVGPFPAAGSGIRHILVVVDYFTRFCWVFPCRGTQATEACTKLGIWLDGMSVTPMAFYSDPSPTFVSAEFGDFLMQRHILRIPAPSKSHRSVGMIEVTNRIFQVTLNKTVSQPTDWDLSLGTTAKNLNCRIIPSLGYSPHELLYGVRPQTELGVEFPGQDTQSLRTSLQDGTRLWPLGEDHARLVLQHVAEREGVVDEMNGRSLAQSQIRRDRHDQRKRTSLQEGEWVMIVQEGKPPKLQPRWRGPFKIARRTGRASYLVVNLDGSPLHRGLPLDIHEDSLKRFVQRTGYLTDKEVVEFLPTRALRRPSSRTSRL